jgi:hypothetical protein
VDPTLFPSPYPGSHHSRSCCTPSYEDVELTERASLRHKKGGREG